MAVNLHATHFRFGIEEFLENTHGWHAAEDVDPAQGAIAVNTTFLLRFTVQETGGTAAANVDNVFECRKNAGAWQAITTTSTIAKAVASVAFTNGQACTKRLSGTGTFESSGAGCTEDGTSGGAANDIAASGNSETECALQVVGADVAAGDLIDFRLTSPDFTITNDVVPTFTVAGATIVEADGASAGVATPSGLMATVLGGATTAAGIAADVVVAVAMWSAVASGPASATIDGQSGSVAGANASSVGVGTVSGTATNTEEAVGASDGIATISGVGAVRVLASGSAGGAATIAGQIAIISAADGTSAVSGGTAAVILND